MTAVVGQALLTFAIIAAIALLILRTPRLVRPLVWMQFLGLSGALLTLAFGMATLDYSLLYVFNRASNTLPMLYRITGVWGGYAGSLLLWSTLLAGWTLIYGLRGKAAGVRHTTLAIMALINIGFMGMLQLSSPFETINGALPNNGRSLNPMLQDIGLVVHPPTLYMGYAGIALVFAMVMANLWHRRAVANWFRSLQQVSLWAWSWLTLGIALGSWWAYLELGWGGWWFWDPVENASLMPWLTLTALIHANLLNRRGIRAGNAIALLSIATMGLMLIGMFIVRSGVMTSVHAFASNPATGMATLVFVVLVTLLGCLLLLGNPPRDCRAELPLARLTFLLMSFIAVLIIACATVLLGTLYPIILESFGFGRISVGPSYFSTFFTPLSFISALLVLPAIAFDKGSRRISAANGAHLGFLLILVSATLSGQDTKQKDLRMAVDQSTQVGEYRFEFTGTTPRFAENFVADFGFIDIYHDDQFVTTVHPSKRLYHGFGQVMTEVGHQPGLIRDFYVVLGEPFADGSWAVRLKVIPFMSMLWVGAALMVVSTIAGLLLYSRCRTNTKTTLTTKSEPPVQEKQHAQLAL